jgi:hypothetical protein
MSGWRVAAILISVVLGAMGIRWLEDGRGMPWRLLRRACSLMRKHHREVNEMNRSIIAMLATMTAWLALPDPTVAMPYYPWCSIRPFSGGAKQCYHASKAQCMATISGIGGLCIENNAIPPLELARPARLHHHGADR